MLVLLWLVPVSLELSPVLRAAAEANKTGCFVVVLKKECNISTFETVQSKLLDLSTDSRLYGSIHNVVMAITVALNDSTLDLVSLGVVCVVVKVCHKNVCRYDLFLMLSTLRKKL